MIPFVAYARPARSRPIAAIFCKRSGGWWHIIEWNHRKSQVNLGAWFRGSLYPRRSSISPDGKLLGYFALNHKSQTDDNAQNWPTSYFAVSKLPWLSALAAWQVDGSWSSGSSFDNKRSLHIDARVVDSKPFYGAWPGQVGTSFTSPKGGVPGSVLLNEDGWNSSDTHSQADEAAWKHTLVSNGPLLTVKERISPRSDWVLVKATRAATQNERAIELLVDGYQLVKDGETFSFPEQIVWADMWNGEEVIVLTDRGNAQVWMIVGCSGNMPELKSTVAIQVEDHPNPQPSPEWANCW